MAQQNMQYNIKFIDVQQAKKHINVKTFQKNCISAMQQYGTTKHAVQHQIQSVIRYVAVT